MADDRSLKRGPSHAARLEGWCTPSGRGIVCGVMFTSEADNCQEGTFMPTEPITLTAIGTGIGAKLIEKLAPDFAKFLIGQAQELKKEFDIKFRLGFSRFLQNNITRFSTVKTIISSNTPIPLLDIYVNLHLALPGEEDEEKRIRDDDFLTRINDWKNVVFYATAGAGKSMLMRYLYLRFLQTQTERLPIFVELRDLNQGQTITIQQYILKKIQEYLGEFSEHQLKYAIEAGYVILFLDGFDEIDFDKRTMYEREINELSARFERLWIFLSTRPAETFANLEKFYIYKVQPFTKEQVRLLITKVNYDQEIKTLFQKKLNDGLYETHREFLVNPLLTIMMLVTLQQFADVPTKIHLFYEYAFEALFGRHDATKGGFKRTRHTSLALDDFKRLFSYFCMYTYVNGLLTFSSEELLTILQQSIVASQIDTNKTLFKNDLTESTCMLALDGLSYTFSHRSFQEYFAAYFICRVKSDEFERAIPQLVRRGKYDNVVLMASEMNREKFEETWALPMLDLFWDSVKDVDAKNDYVGFLRSSWVARCQARVSINRDAKHAFVFYGEALSEEREQIRFILYRACDMFRQMGDVFTPEDRNDYNLLHDIVSGRIVKDDHRFDSVKEAWNGKHVQPQFPILDTDNDWLRGTWLARYCEVEWGLLKAKRDEVAHRVAERKRGLSLFLPPPGE